MKSLVKFDRLDVKHSTDIFRLKQEAAKNANLMRNASDSSTHLDLVVINNATILTMATGHLEQDLVRNGALIVQGGVITAIGKQIDDQTLPEGSTVINANGGQSYTITFIFFTDSPHQDLLHLASSTFMPTGMGSKIDFLPDHGNLKHFLLTV